MPRTAKSSISPRERIASVPLARIGRHSSRLAIESESNSSPILVVAQPDTLLAGNTLLATSAIMMNQTPSRRGKVTLPRRALQREYAFIIPPLSPPAIPRSAEDEIGRLPLLSPNLAAGVQPEPPVSTHGECAGLLTCGCEQRPQSMIVSFKLEDLKPVKFNPLAIPPSDFVLLVQLDALIDAGVALASFQELFVQCHACHIFIARLNLSHHDCATTLSTLPVSSLGDREQLLHCVTSDGLPAARFEALFAHCTSCNRIMTHRASTHHNCVMDKMRDASFS